MQCRYHADREARVVCQKMCVGYCQECLDNCEACTDPCVYCRDRPSCIIRELFRKSEKHSRLEQEPPVREKVKDGYRRHSAIGRNLF